MRVWFKQYRQRVKERLKNNVHPQLTSTYVPTWKLKFELVFLVAMVVLFLVAIILLNIQEPIHQRKKALTPYAVMHCLLVLPLIWHLYKAKLPYYIRLCLNLCISNSLVFLALIIIFYD